MGSEIYFKSSKALIEARDSVHKNMGKLMLESPTEGEKVLISKQLYYEALYDSAMALKATKLINPKITKESDYKKAVQTLKNIDGIVSTKCIVKDDYLVCDKDAIGIIGELKGDSLNMLANEIHDLGMKQLAKAGTKYKNCVISPEIIKEKSLDSHMLAMCDGIMEWATRKGIVPTVTSSTLKDKVGSSIMEYPAQRLDIKMGGHAHTFWTALDMNQQQIYHLDFLDYDKGRAKALYAHLKDIMLLGSQTHDNFGFTIDHLNKAGTKVIFSGKLLSPAGARTLSRFLMGTKDDDFINGDDCQKKMLAESLSRAAELKDKDEITHDEEKSLISNIIACKKDCGFVKKGKTLKSWYIEEGC